MTIENGAIPAANDEIDTDPDLPSIDPNKAPVEQSDGEGQGPELDDEGNPVVIGETEELEWDGKKWVLPKDAAASLKPALLRQADYTKKTQEVAEARRALDADRDNFSKQTEASKAHFKLATQLASLDDQIAAGVQGIPYDKLDWRAWEAQDPASANAAWRERTLLIEKRDAVARDFSQKEQERQGNEQRASAKRVTDAYTAIEQHVPAWKPNSEFETKIFSYGNAQGYKTDVLAQAIIQEPLFARDLARLQAYDAAAAKQKTQQTFEKTQAAQPVTRVGGSGGSANSRRTDNPSGDALSMDEWSKREDERVAAKRKASGLR